MDSLYIGHIPPIHLSLLFSFAISFPTQRLSIQLSLSLYTDTLDKISHQIQSLINPRRFSPPLCHGFLWTLPHT